MPPVFMHEEEISPSVHTAPRASCRIASSNKRVLSLSTVYRNFYLIFMGINVFSFFFFFF